MCTSIFADFDMIFSRILNLLIRPLNFTQNNLSATSDKNTNFNISKHLLRKVGISNSLCSRTLQFTIFKDKLKQGAHIPQTHDPPSSRMSWESCRAVPANSSHLCCVQLALERLLCSKRVFEPRAFPVH